MPIKVRIKHSPWEKKNPEHTAQACAHLKAPQRCTKPTEESLNLELTSCPENCAWMTQVSTDEDNLLNKNFRLHVLLRCSAPAPAAHRSEHRTGHAPTRGEPDHHARCCRRGGGVPGGPQRARLAHWKAPARAEFPTGARRPNTAALDPSGHAKDKGVCTCLRTTTRMPRRQFNAKLMTAVSEPSKAFS